MAGSLTLGDYPAEMFKAVCKLGLEDLKEARRAVQVWAIKGVVEIKNPKSPAATRAADGTF
jgi:hypothetical protein